MVSALELIAKDFRLIQSSRRGYKPYGKNGWMAAIKKIHKHGGSVFAGDLQDKPHTSTGRAFGFSVIGIKLCVQPDLTPIRRGCAGSGTRKKSSTS
jgi:hypothetical protein